MREYRAAKKRKAAPTLPDIPGDPAGALAAWSAEKLKIPPGHPLAGQPLVLPDFGVAFLRDALADRVARDRGACARGRLA